ncbi:MAG: hypothetical protein IJ767_02110 [Bacteroidaceae bacterium]|nr:hypothetical protein [Bacteroidaceae bacterium]
MMELSLNAINARSPYVVTLTPQGFTFQTELGIHYNISFEPDNEIGGCPTYQFILKKVERERSPHDPLVEPTILAIIDEFFRANFNVLLYICDTSDGREAKRNRLFLMWFEKHADPERFTIRTAHAQIEKETLYIAVIVEKRNPFYSDIQKQIDHDAALLSEKPE